MIHASIIQNVRKQQIDDNICIKIYFIIRNNAVIYNQKVSKDLE